MSGFDLLIKNARLRRDPSRLFNIGIKDGIISEISPEAASGDVEIDAAGGLVTEAFVNPHLHMCKVYTLQLIGEEALRLYQTPEMGAAMRAIEIASEVKRRYEANWIYENAKKSLRLAIKHGVLYIRAFVDTDTKAKLEGIKALLKLRDDFRDVVKIQVVAFPQDGVIRDPGAEELVRKAVELGADVVGGIPWLEFTEDDIKRHIDLMFDIAKEYNRDVAMLTDDAGDPGLRSTELLVRKAISEGWRGRVEVCHARAMQLYSDPYFQKLVVLLKEADAGVVSDPHTGPLHARVRELLKAGVTVALGQDDIADAYYPYGRNCMLEVAFLASHLLWMMSFQEMETLYDLITKNPAKIMRIKNYGLRKGCRADLVVLGARSVWEAITTQAVPRFVISGGKIVAETEERTEYHLK